MTSFMLKAVLMGILPFYSVDFPISTFPNEFAFSEYARGLETSQRQLLKKDREFSELVAMVNNERSGWKYDLLTYAPQRIFKSTGLIINCLGTTVVVNYEDKDCGWIQLSKVMKRECPVVVSAPATPSKPYGRCAALIELSALVARQRNKQNCSCHHSAGVAGAVMFGLYLTDGSARRQATQERALYT